jgi:hypothetical protein
MIVFDISVNFDGGVSCTGNSHRRLSVTACDLTALYAELRELATNEGCEFRRIFIFHDIRLVTPAAALPAAPLSQEPKP